MDKSKFKELLEKKESLELNDDFAMEKCWNEMTEILSADIPGAIEFLTNCSEDEFYWAAEVFPEVIEKTQSKELLQAMCNRNDTLTNQEYKESNLTDLKYAKEAIVD